MAQPRTVEHLGDFTATPRMLTIAALAVPVGAAGAGLAWLLLRRAGSTPRRRDYRPDVLDEGASPAQRNQALIDAPPAAQIITPLPGAGTWADATVAMSATGHGESFIRAAAGHALSARLRLGDARSVLDAAEAVLDLVAEFGGDGGLVAVDAAGRVAMPFNSRGMYRGMIGADGVPRTGIYREELVPADG